MLSEIVKKLSNADKFAFDIETSGLDIIHSKIIGLSFSLGTKEDTWWIPLGQNGFNKEVVFEELKPIFSDKDKLCIGWNLQFDYKFLFREGLEIHNQLFDGMVARYLIEEELHSTKYLGLKETVKSLLGKEMKHWDKSLLLFEGTLEDYAKDDAYYTYQLYIILKDRLKKEGPMMEKYFNELLMRVIPVIAKMEYYGVKIDKNRLQQCGLKLSEIISTIQGKVNQIAGRSISLQSPIDIEWLLFHKLGLPPVGQPGKSGRYSTRKEVVDELMFKYPNNEILEDLARFRTSKVLLSSFVDKLLTSLDSNSRVHTHFNLTGTDSGRLSSSDPPLQNIPSVTTGEVNIRSAFVSEKDKTLLVADYSQIELRMLAHLSNDGQLIEAFKRGRDIHQEVANILGVPRSVAKGMNFGVVYGMSVRTLAQNLKVSMQEAKQYYKKYMEIFSRLESFRSEVENRIKIYKFVEDILGRRRHLNGQLLVDESRACRIGFNYLCQGSVASLMLLVMRNLQQEFDKRAKEDNRWKNVWMVLQVHDELVLEVPKELQDEVSKIVEYHFTNPVKLNVPLKVDIGLGESWDVAKPK